MFAVYTFYFTPAGEQAHQTVIMMRVGDEKTAELSLKLSEETNKTTTDKFKLTREDDLLKVWPLTQGLSRFFIKHNLLMPAWQSTDLIL